MTDSEFIYKVQSLKFLTVIQITTERKWLTYLLVHSVERKRIAVTLCEEERKLFRMESMVSGDNEGN